MFHEFDKRNVSRLTLQKWSTPSLQCDRPTIILVPTKCFTTLLEAHLVLYRFCMCKHKILQILSM